MKKNHVRLGIERLEDRRTPSVYYWRDASQTGAWHNGTNWHNANGQAYGLFAYPSTNDEVIFDGSSPNCNVGLDVTIRELHLTAAFTATLSINSSAWLNVDGQSLGDDADLLAGTIGFSSAAQLRFGGGIAVAIGGGGVNFNSTALVKGSIHLHDGAVWNLSGTAPRLNVGMWVGEHRTAPNGAVQETAATVNVGNLTDHIDLVNPNTILVGRLATWNFADPSPGSFDSGGIDYVPGSSSMMGVKGTVNFVEGGANNCLMGTSLYVYDTGSVNVSGQTEQYDLKMYPTGTIPGNNNNRINIFNYGSVNLDGYLRVWLDGGIDNYGTLKVKNNFSAGCRFLSSRDPLVPGVYAFSNWGTLDLQGKLELVNGGDDAELIFKNGSTLKVFVGCYTVGNGYCSVQNDVTIGTNVNVIVSDDYNGVNNPTTSVAVFLASNDSTMTGTFAGFTFLGWNWFPFSQEGTPDYYGLLK